MINKQGFRCRNVCRDVHWDVHLMRAKIPSFLGCLSSDFHESYDFYGSYDADSKHVAGNFVFES